MTRFKIKIINKINNKNNKMIQLRMVIYLQIKIKIIKRISNKINNLIKIKINNKINNLIKIINKFKLQTKKVMNIF